LAGLPEGSRPHVLSLEDAYAIALIESRSAAPGKTFAALKVIDVAALDALRKRFDVENFNRFRGEFFAAITVGVPGSGRFQDPAGPYLEALRLATEVEVRRESLDSSESLWRAWSELVAEGGSGVSQLDLDRLEDRVSQARLELVDGLRQYRDALDALKLRLGLPVHIAIAPDRRSLAPFQQAFGQIARWFTGEGRRPDELVGLVTGLPRPADIVIQGHSLHAALARAEDLEPFLQAGADAALKNLRDQGEAAGARETANEVAARVRRRLRVLLQTAAAYGIEQRRLLAGLRLQDNDQRSILAPPSAFGDALASATAMTRRVYAMTADRVQNAFTQQRLVSLWTTYVAERVALYRDLRSMPHDSWATFLAQFTPPSLLNGRLGSKAVQPPTSLAPR
jgi:hypothetical protein